MSVKGQITTAEPLEFKDFLRLLSAFMKTAIIFGNFTAASLSVRPAVCPMSCQ